MDPLGSLVDELLDAVRSGEASWPGLGTFGLLSRRRMPGFPGFTRLQFRMAETLYRRLNDGEEPPARDAGAAGWAADGELLVRTATAIAAELEARGEAHVPGFGVFGVGKRKTGEESHDWFVAFRADPDLLRRLNPKEKDYEAALHLEWPDGPPPGAEPGQA